MAHYEPLEVTRDVSVKYARKDPPPPRALRPQLFQTRRHHDQRHKLGLMQL